MAAHTTDELTLFSAAEHGNVEVVRSLIQKGVNVNAMDQVRRRGGWGQSSWLILRGYHFRRWTNNNGKIGNCQCNYDFVISNVTFSGYPKFLWANERALIKHSTKNQNKILQILQLKSYLSSFCSQTSLHRAAYYGKRECVELLLNFGADKNIKNVCFFIFHLIFLQTYFSFHRIW